MMSVVTETEINRNHSSAPDLSFFGIKSSKGEEIRVPVELNNSPSLDLAVQTENPKEIMARVSPQDSGGLHPHPSDPVCSLSASEPVEDSFNVEGFEDPLDMKGFEIGDLVWGKVKSHPWWPGHIYKETFASPRVRRSKRDGCLLVAFFGDSSYGWFDPAELIPLAPSFIENSEQTTLKPFLKAVEESVDEACRRAALGLLCRCRDPHCFRLTRVLNYYQVDVVGYEPNGTYSRRQIERAREDFDPEGALGFIKLLAVAQRGSEVKSLEWYQNVAVAQALRKARFEEFDETYAQAFGQQPLQLAGDEMEMLQQAESFAPRVAPLSGSLKIAEDLGHKKKKKKKKLTTKESSSSSSSKSKGKAKQDKLLKESNYERPSLTSGYVLQKRQVELVEEEYAEPADNGLAETRPSAELLSCVTDEPKPNAESSPVPVLLSEETVASAAAKATDEKKKKKKKKKMKMKKRDHEVEAEEHGGDDVKRVMGKAKKTQLDLHDAIGDLKGLALNLFYGIDHNTPSRVRRIFKRFRRVVFLEYSAPVLILQTEGEAHEVRTKEQRQPIIEKSVDAPNSSTAAPKCPRATTDHHREETSGKGAKNLSNLKSVESVKKKKKKKRKTKKKKSSLTPLKADTTVKTSEQEDPPLLVPMLTEDDTQETRTKEAQQRDKPIIEKSDDATNSAARKRPNATEQDEQVSVKRPKKLSQLKSVGSMKKKKSPSTLKVDTAVKNSKQEEPPLPLPPPPSSPPSNKKMKKESPPPSSAPSNKKMKKESPPPSPPPSNMKMKRKSPPPPPPPPSNKKMKRESPPPPPPQPLLNKKMLRNSPPPKIKMNMNRESPTQLIMRFPQRWTLPSVPNLKARFARFGPLDVDSTRVFWRTHMCRVQFKYNSDAQRAYDYVQRRSNDIFGQVRVDYSLRKVAVEAPPPATAEPIGNSRESSYAAPAQLKSRTPGIQLKSILKKPGNEAGKKNHNQRVKFMLTAAPTNNNRPISPPASAAPRSAAADLSPLSLPMSASFSLAPSVRTFEAAPPQEKTKKLQEEQVAVGGCSDGGTRREDVDISHKMLSLLLRCSDIVSHLSSQPGFMPFRPL